MNCHGPTAFAHETAYGLNPLSIMATYTRSSGRFFSLMISFIIGIYRAERSSQRWNTSLPRVLKYSRWFSTLSFRIMGMWYGFTSNDDSSITSSTWAMSSFGGMYSEGMPGWFLEGDAGDSPAAHAKGSAMNALTIRKIITNL